MKIYNELRKNSKKLKSIIFITFYHFLVNINKDFIKD
jgi:hypothetical protein